ncbi:unnamed protein product [Gulo gulo]|uniref:Uncharacterized protein n=1 Tax=Gulo gulo TaxID=48420 RepID=A0A9X9Q6D4_GULGU|nr:unnamed protein product [Gulo gulo]
MGNRGGLEPLSSGGASGRFRADSQADTGPWSQLRLCHSLGKGFRGHLLSRCPLLLASSPQKSVFSKFRSRKHPFPTLLPKPFLCPGT